MSFLLHTVGNRVVLVHSIRPGPTPNARRPTPNAQRPTVTNPARELLPRDWPCPSVVGDGCSPAPWVDGLLFESAELPDRLSRLDDFEGPGYERVLLSARLAHGTAVSAFVYAIRPAGD